MGGEKNAKCTVSCHRNSIIIFLLYNITFIIIYCPLQNGNLTRVQDLVRAVNPTVNFILTDRGELTRSQDIDLILSDSAFLHPDNVRARLLMSRSVQRHERLFISHDKHIALFILLLSITLMLDLQLVYIYLSMMIM